MPLFKEIVSLESILSHPSVTKEKVTSTFEMQVLCPLYTVAWRSPERKLRREAVSMLLCWPRRDVLLDGFLAGKLAEWIMLMDGASEAYDCARQCARADPPSYDEDAGLNGAGQTAYDSRYISCLEACPGVILR
jgi:hypothetical protein